MKKANWVTVLLEVGLLALIVAIVDQTLVRVGLAVIPGMLLAQHAVRGSAGSGNAAGRGAERRKDQVVRDHVNELLQLIREFYTTCHLMRSNQIPVESAVERTTRIEQELNRILGDVVQAVRVAPAETSHA
ncbi:MAG: hypothetical protein HY704_16370 [Gemmatimonadetes bacterium]|nr:hypothetical protein [Gemmatimonadota bacterium]